MECRGQVVTSGGDPSTGRPVSIFIRVKYILKYTNRHIRKNCPLIISLASAPAEGTQSRRHHSNVNLGSMLNINLSFHHQPKHKQCILLHADILFPLSIFCCILSIFLLQNYIRFGVLYSQHRWLQKMFPGEDDIYSDHF